MILAILLFALLFTILLFFVVGHFKTKRRNKSNKVLDVPTPTPTVFLKHNNKRYLAKLKIGRSGKSRGDWFFYNESDELVEDIFLLAMLFDETGFDDGTWEFTNNFEVEDNLSGVVEDDDVIMESPVYDSLEDYEEDESSEEVTTKNSFYGWSDDYESSDD